MKDKIHKILLLGIPLSICNLRCHYCYLSQRDEAYQGIQPEMRYSPEQVSYAFRKERIGGVAFCNLCADGETLLLNNLDKYVEALTKEGHYVEIVTNMTYTPMLKKILSLNKDLLERIEFKCSFHYLELKKRNLLQVFSDNVNLVWNSGCSANIEVTPTDELIPYIDELKKFSLDHFGAFPHFTIARNDRTNNIDYLTKGSSEEYIKTWSQFDSDFFKYKTSIFKVKQKDFCYAGKWSAYVDLSTGNARQCYCGLSLGNVFEKPDEPFPEFPVGKCNLAHCYNGHALLTLGLIPNNNSKFGYGDIRDRLRINNNSFLRSQYKNFINTTLIDTNKPLPKSLQCYYILLNKFNRGIKRTKNIIKKIIK